MSQVVTVLTEIVVPSVFTGLIPPPHQFLQMSHEQTQNLLGFLDEYHQHQEEANIHVLEPYKAIFTFGESFYKGFRGCRAAFLTEEYDFNWALVSDIKTFGPEDLQTLLEEEILDYDTRIEQAVARKQRATEESSDILHDDRLPSVEKILQICKKNKDLDAEDPLVPKVATVYKADLYCFRGKR
jgi:hypothetical protein